MEGATRRPVEVRNVDDAVGAQTLAGVLDMVWGGTGMVPVPVVVAAIHVGGYGSVAWMGEQPVGASIALVGCSSVLHSHATAVLPSMVGHGFGLALKHHQWRWAAAHGFDAVTWTFDPLVRRNAWFNLATLGCSVASYQPDFYGRLIDGINSDGTSDRLLVRWDVAGRTEPPHASRVHPRADDLTIATPADVAAIRSQGPAAVAAWRGTHRAEFGRALARGLVVRGVSDGGDYVLGAP